MGVPWGSTAQGCCGMRQAHRDVAGTPRGTVWHLGEATGAQGSLPQDGCECVWLNSELLCAPKGFARRGELAGHPWLPQLLGRACSKAPLAHQLGPPVWRRLWEQGSQIPRLLGSKR